MKKTSRSGIVFLIVLSLVVLPFYGSLVNVAYAEDIGTEDDNTMKGDATNNEIYGEEGNDTIKGKAGDDDLNGGDGDDTIYGGKGDDDIYGDYMHDGCDSDNPPTGVDHLYGGDGDDYIRGGHGDDFLYGGKNDDTLYGGEDNDELHGNSGNDYLRGGYGDDDLYGGSGVDDIRGGYGDDVIYGGSGNDGDNNSGPDGELSGGYGDDDIYGGNGHDDLYGGYGDDELYGGNGHDDLYGGYGDDELYGENGRDELYGGKGSDIIDGGNGRDYTILQGEIDDYDIVISGDSENTTLTFEQVDSFYDGPMPRAIDEEDDEDLIVDTVTNVEYIEFYDGDEEDDLVDVTFIPLDGSVDNVRRTAGGMYIVDWGYMNDNYFTAYEDDHYFEGESHAFKDNSKSLEDRTSMLLDPENKLFDVGIHSNSFQTSSDWRIVQKWTLGDKVIIFNGPEYESEFRSQQSSNGIHINIAFLNSLFEEHEKSDHPAKTSILWLAMKGYLTDFEALVENIDDNITVAEAVTVLNNYLEYDITENLELVYEEDDVLTKEVMALLFTAAFELDEKEITKLGLQVTEENKAEEITGSQFYTALAECIL